MPYKMGSCRGCKQRREQLAKMAQTAKQFVSKQVAAATNRKGRK